MIDTTLQDLHYGLRSLARTPIFTLTAVLAGAIGIGSTTAVFSVVDLILFRSLPYTDDARLVSVAMTAPILPQPFLLGTDYVEWRRDQTPFAAFTSSSGFRDCDLTESNPVRLTCAAVESTFLATFGIVPQLGRGFTRDEDRPDAPKVVLISDGLWRDRYGADPTVLEQTIALDGQANRIIGVLPKNFEMPSLRDSDVLESQKLPEEQQVRPNTGRPLEAFARLKPGVTVQQAQAALEPLFRESLKWIPSGFVKDVKMQIRPLRDYQVGNSHRASWILFASVLSVLLIACANVANLLLARASSREREIAVRAALGAGRGRLMRQMFTESVMLAAMGGLLGCGLAKLLLLLLSVLAPEGIPRLNHATLDGRVLAFALVATAGSGLLIGMAPALQNPKPETLVGWRAAGLRRTFIRPLLVTMQIAVSLVLLTTASLLMRSLWNLQTTPLGLRPDHVVSASIVLGTQQYPTPERQAAFFEQLEQRIQALPGVDSAAIADSAAPNPAALSTLLAHVQREERERTVDGTGGAVAVRMVTPQYFRALGISLLHGRSFIDEDRTSPDVRVLLSETLARLLFRDEEAVGKRIRVARGPNTYEVLQIIGVAADVKNTALTEAELPEMYMARKHKPDLTRIPPEVRRRATLIVRSALDTQTLVNSIRANIASFDPLLPVTFSTMDQQITRLAARPRFNALLLLLFATIALGLAATGMYGVVAFLVAQRTQEIGVRIAVGAQRSDIVRLMVGQAAQWSVLGIVIGLLMSVSAGRLLQGLLFQVSSRDIGAFLAATMFLTVVAVLAALVPSLRAARVDAVIALRRD